MVPRQSWSQNQECTSYFWCMWHWSDCLMKSTRPNRRHAWGMGVNFFPSQLISCISLCRQCRSILNQYSVWHRGSSLLQHLAAVVAKLLSATDFFWAPSHSHFNSWGLGSRGKGCWNLCLICCLNTSLWIDGLVYKRIDFFVRLKCRYAAWCCLEET